MRIAIESRHLDGVVGRWYGREVSAENRLLVYAPCKSPAGCAAALARPESDFFQHERSARPWPPGLREDLEGR